MPIADSNDSEDDEEDDVEDEDDGEEDFGFTADDLAALEDEA